MQEMIKQELIKRYCYLYENRELILSLAIQKAIEVKVLTKRSKALQKSKKAFKKRKYEGSYEDIVKQIDLLIAEYQKELNEPKYYLFDKLDNDLLMMFEEFLFSDSNMEKTQLYDFIETLKNTPQRLDAAMVKIAELKNRRGNHKFLKHANAFTVWRILTYVRDNNLDNEAVLKALDIYYNLERFMLTGIEWKSGYCFLSVDELNGESLRNVAVSPFVRGVETPYDYSAVITYYSCNEFEKEDDYFVFDWSCEGERKPTFWNAKTKFMEALALSEMLLPEEKQELYDNLVSGFKVLEKR